jgi:hypothetical protein
MIGGIEVFLPLAQGEAEICVADAATAEEQSVVTVRKEESEQTLEVAQADEEEDEHSEEWLNICSQEAEEVVALKLTAEDKVLTPWEMELEMLKDWLNNPEFAEELKQTN